MWIFLTFDLLDLIFFRIWKASGLCTHVLEGHHDAITSVGIVNPEGTNGGLSYLNSDVILRMTISIILLVT